MLVTLPIAQPRVSILSHLARAYHSHPAVESRRPGYPMLSAFMASDKSFVLFKRFGESHTRLLLYKQDELVEIEQRLKDPDSVERTSYHLASRRDVMNPARKALVTEIESKLSAYDKLLVSPFGLNLYSTGKYQDTALETYYPQIERSRPKHRNIESVARCLEGNKPLTMPESSFMDNWGDLMAPKEQVDHGGLDTLVANMGAILRRGLPTVFVTFHTI